MAMESTSHAKTTEGGWLQRQACEALPDLYSDFDGNRDPAIAAQRRDLQKTEAQRREESGDDGRVQKIKPLKTDKPAPALKPPLHMRGAVPDGQWLTQQHSAAMANTTVPAPSENAPTQSPTRGSPAPDQ